MSKVQVGFKFSPEVDARLKVLAEARGETRTAVLEGLVLGELVVSPVEPGPADKIMSGLTDALAYAEGDASKGKAHVVEVPAEPVEKPGSVTSAIDTLRSGKAPDASHMTLAKDKWKKR